MATGGHPHFAPDADMLAIYRRRVAGVRRGATALVLGATPELADVALEAGFRVIRIDRSAAMFAEAARRRQAGDRGNEVEIIADWLGMDMIGRGEIDLVLGDAALNNVAHERMDALLDEVARVTRPGGSVLLRQIVLPDHDIPEYEFAAALAARREGRISLHDLDRVLRFYSLRSAPLEPSRHRLDARRVFQALCAKHAAGELADDEFAFLSDRRSEISHTVYTMSQQARLLARLGDCEIDRLPPSCFFHELMAIFAVRVRSDE
jgi:SAM-dependent methyltransferase